MQLFIAGNLSFHINDLTVWRLNSIEMQAADNPSSPGRDFDARHGRWNTGPFNVRRATVLLTPTLQHWGKFRNRPQGAGNGSGSDFPGKVSSVSDVQAGMREQCGQESPPKNFYIAGGCRKVKIMFIFRHICSIGGINPKKPASYRHIKISFSIMKNAFGLWDRDTEGQS